MEKLKGKCSKLLHLLDNVFGSLFNRQYSNFLDFLNDVLWKNQRENVASCYTFR